MKRGTIFALIQGIESGAIQVDPRLSLLNTHVIVPGNVLVNGEWVKRDIVQKVCRNISRYKGLFEIKTPQTPPKKP